MNESLPTQHGAQSLPSHEVSCVNAFSGSARMSNIQMSRWSEPR